MYTLTYINLKQNLAEREAAFWEQKRHEFKQKHGATANNNTEAKPLSHALDVSLATVFAAKFGVSQASCSPLDNSTPTSTGSNAAKYSSQPSSSSSTSSVAMTTPPKRVSSHDIHQSTSGGGKRYSMLETRDSPGQITVSRAVCILQQHIAL